METIQIHEFDRHDIVTLSEIVSNYLREEGVVTESFYFHIEVTYESVEDKKTL